MRKWEDVPRSVTSLFFLPVGAKEGGLFDDPSYVNVDKPRPPVAANGNAHRDAFDMSKCLTGLSMLCWEYHIDKSSCLNKHGSADK